MIEGNHAAAKSLLAKGALIKIIPTQKNWLHHTAAQSRDAKMYFLLKQYGADENAVDITNESAKALQKRLQQSFIKDEQGEVVCIEDLTPSTLKI